MLRSYASRRSLERVNVSEILRPASGALVGKEAVEADDRKLELGNRCFRARLPGLLEPDTADLVQDVDPVRRDTHLENDPRRGQILYRQALQWSAERRQSCVSPASVVDRGLDPNVEIAGRSWLGVIPNRVSADDEKSDVSVDERLQQIEVIPIQAFVHLCDFPEDPTAGE
jgi:hypothetical protein